MLVAEVFDVFAGGEGEEQRLHGAEVGGVEAVVGEFALKGFLPGLIDASVQFEAIGELEVRFTGC